MNRSTTAPAVVLSIEMPVADLRRVAHDSVDVPQTQTGLRFDATYPRYLNIDVRACSKHTCCVCAWRGETQLIVIATTELHRDA